MELCQMVISQNPPESAPGDCRSKAARGGWRRRHRGAEWLRGACLVDGELAMEVLVAVRQVIPFTNAPREAMPWRKTPRTARANSERVRMHGNRDFEQTDDSDEF